MAKTPITERDLRMPEFRDCTLEELERREDGSIARRDRWEQGIRQLAGIMGFDPRKQFEVADVVAAVKAMKTAVEQERIKQQRETAHA